MTAEKSQVNVEKENIYANRKWNRNKRNENVCKLNETTKREKLGNLGNGMS